MALLYKFQEHHQARKASGEGSRLEPLWRMRKHLLDRRRMEGFWIFGEAISVFLLWCGAVICLANAGVSDAATARGDRMLYERLRG